jgi:hypothetical protein
MLSYEHHIDHYSKEPCTCCPDICKLLTTSTHTYIHQHYLKIFFNLNNSSFKIALSCLTRCGFLYTTCLVLAYLHIILMTYHIWLLIIGGKVQLIQIDQ